ncbi:MAG: hypothetical protein WC082_16295 [Victivallales bacterium]
MEKIIVLKNTCIECEFEALEGFYICPVETLEKIYNGCGPDWLPEFIRTGLTEYFEFFEPAFLEHDYSFEMSDKSREGFNAANKRLYGNCQKLIAARFSWWTEPIKKARYHLKARIIYRACDKFGWSAWLDDSYKE